MALDQYRFIHLDVAPGDGHQSLQNLGQSCRTRKRPVEPLRWYEAVTFCAKLAECTGRHYSLHSQAQLVPGQRLLKRPGKGQRTLRPLAT
jgi:hypothetical protein